MAHPKGLLIERAQKLGLERPEFDTAKTGPEHEPAFITDVVLAGEVIGTGQGRSKRDSEKAAAAEALEELSARESGSTKATAGSAGSTSASRSGGKAGGARPAAQAAQAAPDTSDDEAFSGPWPMFDDLLASVVDVAERRVSADLRGDAALAAIRDFSLELYKELLANLGEVVDEDDDEDDEDDD